MKQYVKLFEAFEEEFEPEFELTTKEPGEEPTYDFKVGDTVTSYRGMGEIVEIEGDFAKVKLHNSKQNVATVPLSSLNAIDKSQIDAHKVRDTQAELASILSNTQDYYDYLKNEAEYVETEEEFATKVNAEKLYEFLEEILIDVMAMFRNDNSTSEYIEYSEIVSLFSLLSDVLVTIDPSYTEKVDTLFANFPG